ncbi:phage protein NinX family protein [Providencia sp. PROV270]|uniref:phage protein NinX family protein n=1 Tax=Providencia sp. PROV270 TaxID=2949958 RepID=UPI00234AB5D2|nr:phage protein NinX family protein [Providencia sp. PROV270]
MNKYTGLSDFEINKKVAEKLRLNFKDGVIVKNGEWFYFDPCNNPSDAMPIIIENGISMVRVNNTWSARQFNNRCIEINGDNYYRIAMETYLLMKDAENED